MFAKYFSNTGNWFKFLMLFAGFSFLTYCTSSHDNVASSFGKRKYTRGHFSDPVAKVKTGYKPGRGSAVVSTPLTTQTTIPDNTFIAKTTKPKAQPRFGDAAKTAHMPVNKAVPAGNSTVQNVTASNRDNISLKAGSVEKPVQPDQQSAKDKDHDVDNMAHFYLLAWLLCIVVGIGLTLVFVLVGESQFVDLLGCLFVGLLFIVYALAVTFFILWIINLAKT